MRLFAYIDPGLGALIWQAAVAGVVGFLFYLKKTRRWIVETFRKIFGRTRKTKTAATEVTVPQGETKTEAR